MEKKFSSIQINTIKTIAKGVSPYVAKKERVENQIKEVEERVAEQIRKRVAEKVEKLQAEKNSFQEIIDSMNETVKKMTGGYTTEDLVMREVTKTGKFDQKTGKEIIQTRYVLKYPETVVPPTEEAAHQENVAVEMPPAGSDFDIDAQNIQQEANDDPWA